MEYQTLSNGLPMPVIGSGTNTFGKVNHDYMGEINMNTDEIESAIKLGYRHFDTAIAYRNEAVIAEGIRRSGLSREDFFLTSKIPGNPEYYASEAQTAAGVEASLKELNTDYIDLYLIHHPWDNNEEILAMWRVLESYVASGQLKAIGVSNFNPSQLEHLIQHAKIKPAANQIESHVGHWNDEIVAYSLEQDIAPIAWSPLKGFSEDTVASLAELAKKYDRTPQQLILRYQIERGVLIIPKSHNPERQAQNIDLFDFSLDAADKQRIATL